MGTSGSGGSQGKNVVLSKDISGNISLIKNIFNNDSTLVTRIIETPSEPTIKYCILYSDGMVNNKLINEDIIKPLLEYRPEKKEPDLIDVIAKQVTLSNSVDKTTEMEKIIQAIIYGDTVLLADGYSEVLILNTKGWSMRSTAEPENEKVLKGPREGFTEALLMNLTMIRRRVRTPELKMEYQTFGTRTKTQACICYMEGLVNTDVLDEFKRRLNSFTIDGTLDVNYITEFIKDAPYSPIKTVGSTERPDVVVARLLEGRVALLLDGTPVALTVPHLFIEHFQSDEDYYINFYFSSIGRILRLIAFFVSTSIPAIYVALTTFHQEMLPTSLVMSISLARQGVPFPTVVESVLMLIVFEMLRESGARMPGMMGQALSIVGALVIGQAAVSAKLVSAPMIIIVAITGISGLMVPHIKGASIVVRFLLLGLSSIMGLYGYMFGMLAFLMHLYNITSFGIPIMSSIYSNGPQDRKDIMIRAPWFKMQKRPRYISPNTTRESIKGENK